uniref:Uncharacterized protein n=1 Tax=Oryza brachyantha TaxID=4533 RepID=J3MCN3_ORYBR
NCFLNLGTSCNWSSVTLWFPKYYCFLLISPVKNDAILFFLLLFFCCDFALTCSFEAISLLSAALLG